MNTHEQAPAPWFKQPWLWFVLAPLFAVLIYASIFVYVAVTTSDGVVKEDYYKVARGMNIDTSRADHARELQVQADLKLDMVTGDANLRLNSLLNSYPDQLRLSIIHPTHQKYDQILTLRSVDGKGLYATSLQGTITSKRYLSLAPMDDSWQVRLEINPPFEDQLSYTLSAQ
ncbi:FixH family protein [Marinobacterium sp. AK62]|uniref:FixH family protein n=1 Tax=Marinobacterium alkalitolerans TaxID=1542925 RepID=A0ABS3ZBB5_9GAMM|nr:FixH family protein [Marinobacterium alkalitolerans]MBP0048977.1 FixH family protein [Marinobacterium alkalitolerans]